MEGRRERHKATRRQAISDAATRLFERDGFEAVTLAQIADAADVSIKTIWNHFGSKEELFFDAEDAVRDHLVATLRDRPRGTSAVAVLRPLLRDGPILAGPCRWSQVDEPLYEGIRAFADCERASPTLSAGRAALIHAWAPPLAQVTTPPFAALLCGLLVARHTTVATGFVERRAVRTIERRTRALLDPALDALEPLA